MMQPNDFLRLANNFYASKNIPSDIQRISLDAELINYFTANQNQKKYKVAFVFICLNPLYWQYANEMVVGARQFFLPGHQTDYFFWTDIPENPTEIVTKYKDALIQTGLTIQDADIEKQPILIQDKNLVIDTPNIIKGIQSLRGQKDIHIIPTEAVDWPYPTLLRYNLFLQEEEKLKEYDYIFYCDVDMRFMNVVGDEILGQGLTSAPHPGYYVRKELYPPYEPNEQSASYIKRPGKVMNDNGKPRFVPHYYAGGFQGGTSDKYIEAMKACKILIEKDLDKAYIPVWNDESAWNKYLSENTPEIFLDPSYIYPDSLIKEYYEPFVWGRSFIPRLVCVTKWFSTSKEGGQAVAQMIGK